MDFNLNVNILLNISPKMEAILLALLGDRVGKLSAPAAEQQPEQQPEQQVAQEPTAAPVETKPEPKGTKTYTVEQVRNAIGVMRQRLEGADYETNSKSELRVKYHKKITQYCKYLARLLGGNKPTELDGAKRYEFVETLKSLNYEVLDSMEFDDEGNVTYKQPPFES